MMVTGPQMPVQRDDSDMPALVACDLDRTLIYSAAALGLAGTTYDGTGAPPPRLVVAEMDGGFPRTYLTRPAEDALRELERLAVLVPTTTRTFAQYSRVRVTDGVPAYAVVLNGGQIVADGRVDEDWTRHVHARLAEDCAPTDEVAEHVWKVFDPRWTTWLRVADDLFCYAVVDREEMPAGFVTELAAWCDDRNWSVSLQGRKVYAVPRPLTKSAALAEIAHRTGARRLLAAGDSLLDADMLEAAHFGVRPAHGELHDLGWSLPHVVVTEAAGVLAGEQIAQRLLAAVLDGGPGR
jgi:hydroxymethylpyrimidine pyrophosphatase-like HAD family hydrolase